MADGPQHDVLFVQQGGNPLLHRIVGHDQAAHVVRSLRFQLAMGVAVGGEGFQPDGQRCSGLVIWRTIRAIAKTISA